MTVREQRAGERARYLEVNLATYPDTMDRWYKYEDLILAQYGPAPKFPPETRSQRLDKAWLNRDKGHNIRAR